MSQNANTAALQQDESSDRLRTLHIMLTGRYPYAIILAILGLVAGALGGYKLVTPIYRSDGTVQVEQFAVTPLNTEEQRIRNLDSYIQAQMEMLISAEIINDAMKHEKWLAHGRPEMGPIEFAASIGTTYDSRRGRAQEIFRVSFFDQEPATAQAGLEALLTAYERWSERVNSEQRLQLIRVLERMRAECQQDITNLTDSILRIAPKGLDGLAFDASRARDRLDLLDNEIEQTRLALEEARRNGLDAAPAGDSLEFRVDKILASGDATMRALVQQLNAAQSQYDVVVQQTGSNHPQARRMLSTVNVAREAVQEYAWNFDMNALGAAHQILDPVALQQRLSDLTEARAQLDSQISNLTRLQLNVQQLERRRELEHNRLVTIIDRITAERTPGRNEENRVRVLGGRGTVPSTPFNSGKQKQMALMGGVLGGAMGFGIILLIGAMDRRLRDSDDVRWTTGNTGLLGVLPTLPTDLADPEQAGIASHCVHHIRALLQVADHEYPHRVFSVTSPASGTGKTSLTLALGLSFAESGSRTLLIDCDLLGGQLSARVNAIVRRRVGQILKKNHRITDAQLEEASRLAGQNRRKIGTTLVEMGLLREEDITEALDMQADSRVGLLDAITGEDIRQCVAESGFDHLAILPIGQAQPHDAGKLSPTSIRRLLHEALKHYDVVLIDTGPIPASLEASVVASEADGVILTVSRGEQRPLAVKAKKHLESIGAHVAGVVFNRAESREVDTYSYRPRSLSGENILPGSGRIRATFDPQQDQRSATYGPIAQAVSLSQKNTKNKPDIRNRNGADHGSNGNGRHEHE